MRFDGLKANVYSASIYSSYDAHVMLLLLLLLFMQNLFFEALLILLDLTGFSSRPKQGFDKNFRMGIEALMRTEKECALTCFRHSTNAYCDELMASTNKLSILLAML